MKYKSSSTTIPFDRREEINNKILDYISLSKLPEPLTPEDIYNAYTGVGGLHGLERSQFPTFHEYTQGKKEIEQGQFLTPDTIVSSMVKFLPVHNNDLIADLTFGTGRFFNYFNEKNCYGCEIDFDAYRVAKFLFPESKLENIDIRFYKPNIKFDIIIGNPPFNLRWDLDGRNYLSQFYFALKAYELLHAGGLLYLLS